MDLRFLTPDLRKLDLAGTEVLVATLTADERPPLGVVGLVDWRLAGRISRLIRKGFVTGELGECVLIPGKPRLPFDKIVLLGVGRRDDFDEQLYSATVAKMLRTLEGLRARSAVVELPGRKFEAIAPERAADLLLQAGASSKHDTWTLVEPLEAQRTITQHMIQARRRIRTQ